MINFWVDFCLKMCIMIYVGAMQNVTSREKMNQEVIP